MLLEKGVAGHHGTLRMEPLVLLFWISNAWSYDIARPSENTLQMENFVLMTFTFFLLVEDL